jgi:hypothetical protein
MRVNRDSSDARDPRKDVAALELGDNVPWSLAWRACGHVFDLRSQTRPPETSAACEDEIHRAAMTEGSAATR